MRRPGLLISRIPRRRTATVLAAVLVLAGLTAAAGPVDAVPDAAPALQSVDAHAARDKDNRVGTASPSALMLSPFQPFSDDEWQRLDTWLDRIYDDFVGKAAAGRGVEPERMHELARGRVWSGADAHERGLVDELGGLATAVTRARERAGLPPDGPSDVVAYPQLPLLARLRPATSSEDEAAASVRIGFDAWGTFAPVAALLGWPTAGPLTLPGTVLPEAW